MNTRTIRFLSGLGAALIFSVSLAGCRLLGNAEGSSAMTGGTSAGDTNGGESAAGSGDGSGTTASAAPVEVTYGTEDTSAAYDAASATAIVFSGSTMSIQGSGASAKGSVLTISAAGTYILSGTLTAGQVVVDAGKEDTVRLILNGVSITCANSAPLYAKKAAKTILTLADGTQNALTDGASYTFPDAETDEPSAAVFSKNDLTINGGGTLTVTGQYNNGIASKDVLTITGGTIRVTAAGDGLRGKDGVAIQNGTFTIDAGTDGIKSTNDTDADKGWISLDGGTYSITAANDGVQAETVLQIAAGTYTLKTGGGSANSSTDSKGDARPGWGQWSAGGSETTADAPSAKGLKAGAGILLTGGVFTVDSSDDAIHSNGSVAISGGEYTLTSGDDGIHADAALTISKGTIRITKSYEGLEGGTIDISGGDIQLKASDDGLNAAGGSDSSAMNGRPGQNGFSMGGNSSYYVRISGGNLLVDADGDGLDSNGNLYIDGGTILVCGPTGNGNGALDYDGSCEITGGILVAAGSAGMAEAPGSSSSQCSLMVTYSSTQPVGTPLALTAPWSPPSPPPRLIKTWLSALPRSNRAALTPCIPAVPALGTRPGCTPPTPAAQSCARSRCRPSPPACRTAARPCPVAWAAAWAAEAAPAVWAAGDSLIKTAKASVGLPRWPFLMPVRGLVSIPRMPSRGCARCFWRHTRPRPLGE